MVVGPKLHKSLLCRCGRGIYKVYGIGLIVADPTMIKLDSAFFADCVNCGAQWLADPTLPSDNLMLAHTTAAKDRIAELRKLEWDSQFQPKKEEQLEIKE